MRARCSLEMLVYFANLLVIFFYIASRRFFFVSVHSTPRELLLAIEILMASSIHNINILSYIGHTQKPSFV